ncbi:MAG TPA: hypothetical protein VFA50_10085 [Stellaceae bacterium]|nr:hypothetical protein [Stellaceae bacterium]
MPAAERFPVIREAVGSFADRARFRRAVSELLAAGFRPDDLSVLGSHDSLAAAGDVAAYRAGHSWLPEGLAEEINYLGPLTIAGIILVSGGPVAAGIAALIGAGLGGAALKEILDRYAAPRHSAEFAAALAAGAVLLWVRCPDPESELSATRILEAAGGQHVHMHGRPAGEG